MAAEGDPPDSYGLRVLVVDDDADVRLLCRLNLMSEGHQVLEAASGSMPLSSCTLRGQMSSSST